MKKIIPIIAIICVIFLSSTFFIIRNYNDHKSQIIDTKENSDDKIDIIIDETTTQEENNQKEEISKEKEETKSNEKPEEKKTNTNKNNNINNNTKKPNNNVINNSNNNTSNNSNNNSNNNTSNINDSKPIIENPKTKGICNNSNDKWVAYLSKWKASNPTSVTFDNKADAISYGKYAMNDFGYAYEISTIPVAYEDEECKNEIWSTRLSVPQKTCVDSEGNYNKQIWLKATSKKDLIDIYDFLRKQGYDCGTKKWYKD